VAVTETPVVYRRAEPGDAGRLAQFATQAFTDTYAAFNTPENMAAYLGAAYGSAQQAKELSDASMRTVLAESAGRIVGYAQLRRGEAPPCVTQANPVEIYRFYVDRSAHGTGVAARLMNEAKLAALELGGQHIWLGVWERNARAIAFYRKSGFVDVGTQIFQLGGDPQTDRVLVSGRLGE